MSDSRLENIFANLLLVNALLEIPFKRKYNTLSTSMYVYTYVHTDMSIDLSVTLNISNILMSTTHNLHSITCLNNVRLIDFI